MVRFHGYPYQRGSGIGNILGGLYKTIVKPWLMTNAKKLSPHAAKFGQRVLSDVIAGRNIRQSLKRRGIQTGNDVVHEFVDIPAKRRRRNNQTGAGFIRKSKKTIKKPNRTKTRKNSHIRRKRTAKIKRKQTKKKRGKRKNPKGKKKKTAKKRGKKAIGGRKKKRSRSKFDSDILS